MEREHKQRFGRYSGKHNKPKNLPRQNTLTTLGLVGNEIEKPAPNNTVCFLCKREIHRGDPCLKSSVNKGRVFYIHANCVLAEMTRMHVVNRPVAKTKQRRQDPKARVSDGNVKSCSFCHKHIGNGREYIVFGKKNYHSDNQTEHVKSCWSRYKRVRGEITNSLRMK